MTLGCTFESTAPPIHEECCRVAAGMYSGTVAATGVISGGSSCRSSRQSCTQTSGLDDNHTHASSAPVVAAKLQQQCMSSSQSSSSQHTCMRRGRPDEAPVWTCCAAPVAAPQANNRQHGQACAASLTFWVRPGTALPPPHTSTASKAVCVPQQPAAQRCSKPALDGNCSSAACSRNNADWCLTSHTPSGWRGPDG
jgi:hypothetical protein